MVHGLSRPVPTSLRPSVRREGRVAWAVTGTGRFDRERDDMSTTTATVMVRASHQACGRRNAWWVEPVGWKPVCPVEFAGDEFDLIDGSVWGEEEEEAGLVFFGETEEGEELEVSIKDLNWVYCNASGLQRLDEPYVTAEVS